MPLSSNEATNTSAKALIDQFHIIFGNNPGYRPAHAKGQLVKGTFTSSSKAAELSSAPQFNQSTTPITVRLSSSTGLPGISDTNPSANPRGFALRFHLGDRIHTDMIVHSTPFFPVRTGLEFLELLKAQIASSEAQIQDISPTPFEEFLEAHPETVKFIQAPKPSPVSFATGPYFGIEALKFVAADGHVSHVRYRVQPVAGEDFVSGEDLKTNSSTYLFDELSERLGKGPIEFKLLVQIAHEDDMVDDATVHWPEDREVVELGTIKLDTFVSEDESKAEQKRIIFDPIPRVQGIEPSDDPLLDFRAAIYLMSGRERRETEYKE